MTTDPQKRQAVLAAYPLSQSWKYKVRKMSDAQVTAVYLRLKEQGKIRD